MKVARGVKRRVLAKATEARRFGLARECLVCGARLRKFEPRGVAWSPEVKHRLINGGLRDTTCPQCGSYDRERILYAFLKGRPELFRGKRILHVAHDDNIAALVAPESAEHVTGDKLLAHYGAFLDICALDFPDGSFDLVICNHVLEHVENDAVAMRELLRVTAPGGKAILQVPWCDDLDTTIDDGPLASDEERLIAYGQIDHVRVFGKDYPDRLRATGWLVEVIPSTAVIPVERHAKLGINSQELIFLATRPPA